MSRQAILFKRGLLASDVAISAGAFALALHARWLLGFSGSETVSASWVAELDLGLPRLGEAGAFDTLLLAMLPVWAFAFFSAGVTDFRLGLRQISVRYLRAVAISLGVMIASIFLFKLHFVPRSFVILLGAVQLFALIFARTVVMETVALLRRKHPDGHRMVIVGCSREAESLAATLRVQPPWNIKLEGHVCVSEGKCPCASLPLIERLEQLDRLLDRQPVDEVVFVDQDLDPARLANAIRFCDERGVDILLPLPPLVPSQGRCEVTAVDGYPRPLLSFRRTPTGEVRLAAKRAMDIIGALVAIALASPIMIAAAIAVKAGSKGPVFFCQMRSGRNGRRFKMFKFRSMVADAEARKAELLHLNEMSGPVFKIQRDPRVTRVGAFIRKTSIDELPQLFNILLGDMSLVGPRPPLPTEVEAYEPWQRRRLSVKPGLTGLWQVSGRNQIDFEQWMQLDLRYIDTWSLWLDMKILLRTFPAVLKKTGAS